MEYIVLANSFRPPVFDKEGKVKSVDSRVYRGGIVDLPEDYAARLVAHGSLVLAEGYSPVTGDVADGDSTPESDDDGASDDTTADDTSDDESTEDTSDDDGDEEEQAGGDIDMPDLAALSFNDLQSLAKEVTGNGGGSRDELVERLTEHYTNN